MSMEFPHAFGIMSVYMTLCGVLRQESYMDYVLVLTSYLEFWKCGFVSRAELGNCSCIWIGSFASKI